MSTRTAATTILAIIAVTITLVVIFREEVVEACPLQACSIHDDFSALTQQEKINFLQLALQELTSKERLVVLEQTATFLDDDDAFTLTSLLFRELDAKAKAMLLAAAGMDHPNFVMIVSITIPIILIASLYAIFRVIQFFRVPQRTTEEAIPLTTYRDNRRYNAEKRMPDSPFIKAELHHIPKCQASVRAFAYSSAGVDLLQEGQGFRDPENRFITAAHVVEGADYVIITSPTGNQLQIDISCFVVNPVVDYAAAVLSAGDWSCLGLRSSIYPKKWDGSAIVTITDLDQISSGLLSESTHFLNVQYAGSTIPGFSGAPLVANGTVYGMHVGAGQHNCALVFGVLDYLSRYPYLYFSKDDDYIQEANKKSKNKRSKVDDDTYLEYAKQDARKSGRKLKVMASSTQGLDHGVLVKGKGGRFVHAEEFDESYMELVARPKVEKYIPWSEEAISLERTSETPQFNDVPATSGFRLAPACVSDTRQDFAQNQNSSHQKRTPKLKKGPISQRGHMAGRE